MEATLPKVMSTTLPISPSAQLRHDRLDRLGATGSMLCAVHCAVLPLLLVLTPAIGAWFGSTTFEYGFIAFANVLALTSLLLGYRRHHVGRALAVLFPGIGLLWAAVLIDQLQQSPIAHAVAMATGGMLLAIAHIINMRLSHQNAHGCQTDHGTFGSGLR